MLFTSLTVALFSLIFSDCAHSPISYTYNAPVHKFTEITKSWFDIQWYGGAVVSNTTGTDSVPGATRSGFYGETLFHETLTMYSLDPDALAYSLRGESRIYVPPDQPVVHIGRYTETMRIESICSGAATYINIRSYLCSNDSTQAYDLAYTLQTVAFQGIAARIHATVMGGDCLLTTTITECQRPARPLRHALTPNLAPMTSSQPTANISKLS
ncbi:hypothetical protein DFH08DRAFT_1087633 [Mycena albidolilacea]|uniref:Uncharacterized protein n=1 Tax=Mycena albidolilacea TaxID=1033008 RepID=A0AAD6Z8N5_9AGAR|nr:hypothetical protein DFH08DRAFT_1087633 [Mycena albidolilacea]